MFNRLVHKGLFVLLFLILITFVQGQVAGDPVEKIDWLNRGIISYNEANYKDAKLYFENALNEDNNNVIALNYKGNTFVALGDYDAAIKCYDQALKIDPNNILAMYNKGIALRANHDAQAEDIFANARDLLDITSFFKDILEITGKIEEEIHLSDIEKARLYLIFDIWGAKSEGDDLNKFVVPTPTSNVGRDIEIKTDGQIAGFFDGIVQGIEDAKKGYSDPDPIKRAKYLNTFEINGPEQNSLDSLNRKGGYKLGYPDGYNEGNIIGKGISVSVDINPNDLQKQTARITVTATTKADGKPLDKAIVKLSISGPLMRPSTPSYDISGGTDSSGKFVIDKFNYGQMASDTNSIRILMVASHQDLVLRLL